MKVQRAKEDREVGTTRVIIHIIISIITRYLILTKQIMGIVANSKLDKFKPLHIFMSKHSSIMGKKLAFRGPFIEIW